MSKLFGIGGGGMGEPKAPRTVDKPIVRNILVNITGNRMHWQNNGVHGALWRVNHDQAKAIFAPDDAVLSSPQLQDRIGRALIRKVTVLESNSNIDDIVGVVVDNLPPHEFTANADGASLYLTGRGRVTTPQEIFNLSANSELGLAWMQKFPQYTRENLDQEGAMQLVGANFHFIKESHPVVYYMSKSIQNVATVLIPVPQPIPQTGHAQVKWFQLDSELFLHYVKELREVVLHRAPATFDLHTLTVRLVRPDNESWASISPVTADALVPDSVLDTNDEGIIQQAKDAALERYYDRPLQVTLRLAIEYTLPQLEVSRSEEDDAPPAMVVMQTGG